MDDFEYGACFDVWLSRTLTPKEKTLLKEYEMYLESFRHMKYSFGFEFKVPVLSKPEKEQLLKTIGYIPTEELNICGLATPLFRSIEAILKHFGGYAKISVGNLHKNNPNVKGEYYTIIKKKYISHILLSSSYQLIDWKIVEHFFNHDDSTEIKEIYSIPDFLKRNSYGNH